MKLNDRFMTHSALYATWFGTTVSSTVVVLPRLHAPLPSRTLLSRFVLSYSIWWNHLTDQFQEPRHWTIRHASICRCSRRRSPNTGRKLRLEPYRDSCIYQITTGQREEQPTRCRLHVHRQQRFVFPSLREMQYPNISQIWENTLSSILLSENANNSSLPRNYAEWCWR